jgi:hypothetical protein
MSTLKVDQILKRTGTGTITLGQSGDTISIPSGTTLAVSGTATGVGGVNTPAFFVFLGANQGLSHDTHTKIAFNTERYDTASAYDNSSNYRFTVPSGQGGKYFLFAGLRFSDSTANLTCKFVVNGSNRAVSSMKASSGELETLQMTTSQDLSAGDYVEVFGRHQSSGTLNVFGNSSEADSYFGGFKLIE